MMLSIHLVVYLVPSYLFSHQWLDTPLDVASEEGHLHIVRLLLHRGAMIETRDEVRQ